MTLPEESRISSVIFGGSSCLCRQRRLVALSLRLRPRATPHLPSSTGSHCTGLLVGLLQRILQPVINDGSAGRIFPDRARPAEERWMKDRLIRRRGSEQVRLLLRNGIVVLPQRADVIKDPEGAAVSRDDQIVVLDDQVVDRRHRQVQLQRLPLAAVVERDVDALLGSGEEQSRALGIDADGMNIVIRGNAVHQLGPGLAEVGGLEDVGGEVVHLVPFDGHVSGARRR